MATRLNRPRPKPGKSSNRFAIILGLIALVLFLVPMLVGVYTDFRWFGELDYRGVFTKTILARVALFVIFGLVGAAITWAAAFFAWRGRERDDDFLGDPNSPMTVNRAAIQSGLRPLLRWVPLAVGLVSGLLGQSTWRTFMLWLNGGQFGSTDAQFGRDLGFYAFALPALTTIVSVLSMLLVVAFLVGLVGHYLLGGIRIASQAAGTKGHISRPALIQLAVTAGLWMLVKALDYWLQRYSLLFDLSLIHI